MENILIPVFIVIIQHIAVNSVLIVINDTDIEKALSRADYLVELGPGSGAEGGLIVYSGPPR